jgi:hypothetical protein
MVTYRWTDASALYQAKHGHSKEPRTKSAWEYIEARLDDYSPEEINGDEDKEDDEPSPGNDDDNENYRPTGFG